MAVDLHVHSSASDGTAAPGEIPALAAAAGLTAVALTDHDTVAGLTDFLACQAQYPDLQLIPGVEISSRDGAREIHIVGLFIDHNHTALQEFTAAMRRERMMRAEQMQQKLSALGYIVSWDDLCAAGLTGDVPGRPHFAQVLINKYNFPDTATVFARLLKPGTPGYVPRNLPDPATAVKVIKAAGGVAIWAHPFSSRNNINNYIRRTLKELKIAGLDALEAYYPEYTPTRTATALQMASEYQLAVSGGSDFHGSIHPDIQLGRGRGSLQVPDEVLEPLKKALQPKVVIL